MIRWQPSRRFAMNNSGHAVNVVRMRGPHGILMAITWLPPVTACYCFSEEPSRLKVNGTQKLAATDDRCGDSDQTIHTVQPHAIMIANRKKPPATPHAHASSARGIHPSPSKRPYVHLPAKSKIKPSNPSVPIRDDSDVPLTAPPSDHHPNPHPEANRTSDSSTY